MLRVLAVLVLATAPAAAHTITGTVLGPDGPVTNATVDFHYETNPGAVGHRDTTDAQGRFSGPAPDGQILFLSATPPAGSDLDSVYDGNGLAITRDYEVRLTLRRIVRVRGEIRAADGRLVPGKVKFQTLTVGNGQGTMARQDPVAEADAPSGTFELQLPGDFYSIHGFAGDSELPSGRLNVDARANLSGLRVTLSNREGGLIPKHAPRRDRIAISAAGENFDVTLTGAAGASEPLSAVSVLNLMTGQMSYTVSAADGSFSLRMFGAPGSTLVVRHDPTGWYSALGPQHVVGLPATYLHISGGTENAFSAVMVLDEFFLQPGSALTTAIYGTRDVGQVVVTGSFPSRQWQPGQTVSMSGKVLLFSKNLGSDVSNVRITGNFGLIVRFDRDGMERQTEREFHSTDFTPTGLPIERYRNFAHAVEMNISAPRATGSGRAEADWSLELPIPPNMADGMWQPSIRVAAQGVPTEARVLDGYLSIPSNADTPSLPLVTVGSPNPPRLFWALGLDEFDNGIRGTMAREDAGLCNLANHVLVQPSFFLYRWKDHDGEPIRYRLEPFLPLSAEEGGTRPPIAFQDGSLTVRVHRPDGGVDDLGTAALVQFQNRMPLTRADFRPSLGTAGYSLQFEMTTLDPRFEYAFTRSGLHRVEMRGTMTDAWGTVYEGGGTYEVIAGQPLDIDAAVIPGTPMFDGSSLNTTVHLSPPVPADVEIHVRHVPFSDPVRAIDEVFHVRANRFGYAHAPPFVLRDHGEFRVDIKATYVDSAGVMWAGSTRWGSVVETSDSPIITHGRRGFDGAPEIGQQWFGFKDDGQQPGDHVMYPFHSGDVMWMEDSDRFSGLADSPIASLQDPTGFIAQRVRDGPRPQNFSPVPIEDRIAAGEIPIFTTDPHDANLTHEPPSQWGYAYLYAERPSVRVREIITEDFAHASYWRFRDNYHFQLGNGINGDLPNDFKFQFAGAVWREPGFQYYGAYASLFVLVPELDPAGGRIMPPFQGNGGGPDGGPLFRLKGRDIDLFFHPTAVRPGTILHRGAIASFAGYSAPTLPSKIEIVVTSPSGRVRTIAGQANRIGWFYDPSQDFTAGESGVWKARVRIVFDGRTSAGQVTEPFPAGDALGSREGEFYFYVVDANA
ncbi:MAG TPA: hypothetical protein VMT00_08035, partial [Thermoanaerobaculia bacterium]|nr:hypothetical protein [Thermoanaerobaculia bacterium]